MSSFHLSVTLSSGTFERRELSAVGSEMERQQWFMEINGVIELYCVNSRFIVFFEQLIVALKVKLECLCQCLHR